MKKIAIPLDYDGCVLNTDYAFPFTPENMGDIEKNTSIIDCNSVLWYHLLQICKQHSDLELVTIVPFSNRQDAKVDAVNSERNESESFFLALDKIRHHLAKLLADNGISADVKLSRLLLTDLYRQKNHGATYDAALVAVDCSLTGLGKIPVATASALDTVPMDETKIILLFANVQAIDASAFYCFDDNSDILNVLTECYKNPIGASLIPRDIEVTLCHYEDGQLMNPNHVTFIGTGERYKCYAEIVRQSLKIAPQLFPQLKPDNKSSMSDSLKLFAGIIHRCENKQTSASTHVAAMFSSTSSSTSSSTTFQTPTNEVDDFIQQEFFDFGQAFF